MNCFFVDGSSKSFADIILQYRVDGKKCLVASYGFGVLQVRKIISAFDAVVLVADISHATLNATAYDTVVEMSAVLPSFSFIATRTHAKLALIDDEIVVFTSANLSANRRVESYMIGEFREFTGIENLEKIFSNTSGVLVKPDSESQNDLKVVDGKYLTGGINEPSYTHVIDDKEVRKKADEGLYP